MSTKIIHYDLNRLLPTLEGVEKYDQLRVYLFSGTQPIGKLTVQTGRRPISQQVLLEEIAHQCLASILENTIGLTPTELAERLIDEFNPPGNPSGQVQPTGQPFGPSSTHRATLRAEFKVQDLETRNQKPETNNSKFKIQNSKFKTTLSIVVPTRDRPDDLRRCLASLVKLKSHYRFEIVVSDNNPASGLSEPIARAFPVKYVAEARAGASYARNAGVAQSSGEIIVFTDDDVKVAADWLDKLVAPFAEPEVMCVTGLVLPIELETRAQELFEGYGAGGLERGFVRRKLGPEFFKMWRGSVQTWQLGGTANCAIRAEVFTRSELGPFDESLGPGTPAGVGEDTYMFYRILKGGYSCVYEPVAVVYHRHRRDMRGLRRQLYSYAKGATAQQIRILLTDKDRRALHQIVKLLPEWQLRRIKWRLRGWDDFPLHVILLEMWGNILGIPGFFQSVRLVEKQGRITPAQIAAQRSQVAPLWIPRGNLNTEDAEGT